MNTKILYSSAFAFILASLLTSCAFLQKEEFAQRKYYNFPHTKHSFEGVKTEQASAPLQKTVTGKIPAKATVSSEKITTASVDKKQVSAAYKEPNPFYSEKYIAKPETENKIQNVNTLISLKRAEILKIAREKTAHSASNSDALLIIELILALVLPPLAIIIKSGKASKWFWITLLLCILAGILYGMSYIGGAGFVWLVAAIIALLFVFGTIRG